MPRPPAPQPMTQPAPSPVIPIAIYVALTLDTACPIGKRLYAEKKRKGPRTNKKRRRQRPCTSGDPIVTYEEKKKKIGRFHMEKAYGRLTGSPDLHVLKKTEKTAKDAGYNIKPNGKIRIFSELDDPKGIIEIALSGPGRGIGPAGSGPVCFYQVYAVEKRRKCKCPDGSKCRSTTRND